MFEFQKLCCKQKQGEVYPFLIEWLREEGAEEERRYFILIIVGIMIVIVRIVTLLRVANVGSGCPIS